MCREGGRIGQLKSERFQVMIIGFILIKLVFHRHYFLGISVVHSLSIQDSRPFGRNGFFAFVSVMFKVNPKSLSFSRTKTSLVFL